MLAGFVASHTFSTSPNFSFRTDNLLTSTSAPASYPRVTGTIKRRRSFHHDDTLYNGNEQNKSIDFLCSECQYVVCHSFECRGACYKTFSHLCCFE
jgi:hypothetical protein